MTRATVIVPVVALMLAGCASAPPTRQESFGKVEQVVAERTGGRRVYWQQGTDADREAARGVDALLAGDADAAVQVALLNNRRLQATYEDLGMAQAELVQAGLLRNSVFDAEVRFAEGGGGTGLDMAVVLEFLDVLYIPLRQRIAAALAAAEARVAGAAIDLAASTRSAYYDAVAARQLVEIRRTALDAADASHEIAKRLFEAGNVPELDVVSERAAYEQSKLDLAAAESDAVQRRERLNRLMGLWGPQAGGWQVPGRLPEPQDGDAVAQDQAERQAVERSLDLEASRKELTALGERLGVARSTLLLPELELGAAAEREPDGGWSVGPAVAFPIPLFDQGQGRLATAQAELRRARQSYHATAVEVRSAARAAHAAVTSARDRARHYRTVVIPLRQTVTGHTQRQFNAMQVGPFQLLAAKQQEVEAGAAYVEALRDYWNARTRLDQLLAGRMPDADAMPATGGPARATAAGAGAAIGH